MKRKQRTEVLINGSSKIASELSQVIKSRYEIEMIQEPKYGLVMVQVRETAQKSLFYLGEVLVTECKVKIGGAMGVGIIKGDEPDRAYDLAVVDAAYGADLSETETWQAILQSEADRIAAERKAFHQKVLRTKVNFETMDTD
ncbi:MULTISPECIES: phosphonate C-P lyase system protein PhnG [unclassified Paenibacillus]|uniref:phosphonate C-P lyase system protein PhnG n=1 Tax=unclassified Paenibacillus TaxID=185978 RepID=UPI003636154F